MTTKMETFVSFHRYREKKNPFTVGITQEARLERSDDHEK